MCGLCGSFSPRGIKNRGAVPRMLAAIQHRGPDEVFSLDTEMISAKLARLGMVGLAQGWQPSSDRSGRFVALTNGEIYNHADINRTLGITASNNTVDVAVIPEIVAQRGISGLELIDGQFATVVLDTTERVLFLARDRFGICPLLYTVDRDLIHFCSELKPLVQSLSRDWRLNPTAVSQYLSLGNIVAPTTIVDEISSVPPGCAIRFDGTSTDAIRYWRYGPFESEEPHADDVFDILLGAVNSRIKADVEIGAYLSGGFDSSALVALASSLSSQPIRTFSSVFDDPILDERRFQRSVSSMYATKHSESLCKFESTVAGFEAMVRHCCAPQRESYNVAAQLLASDVHAAGIKGILSGEGADELFFGYDSYAFDSATRRTPTARPQNHQAWGSPVFTWEVDWSALESRRTRYLTDSGRELLQGHEFWRERIIPFSDEEVSKMSALQLRSVADVYVQLSGHLLGDHGDSMLMSHSVEGRYPFLANHVVDLALRTPDDRKMVDFDGKAILKNALNDRLPESILRRGKQGFTAPPLRQGVAPETWTRWTEMVRESGLFAIAGLVQRPGDEDQKWDFGLSAISLSIVIDELGLKVS